MRAWLPRPERNKMKRKALILIVFLTAITFTLTICSPPAYAADEITMTVNAAWVDGDLIKIEVIDKNGTNSTLAIRLSDYVPDVTENEYISIQAVDLDGNKSSVIQIKNPYYIPTSENADKTNKIPEITVEIIPTEETQAPIPEGKPFTPDGSGTVMDNILNGEGKEFFTVKTEDGNVFYLIVDRNRNSENVYLLNAVTEDDLKALAQKKNNAAGGGTSIVPTTETATTEQITQPTTAAPEPDKKPGGMNGGAIIFIIIAVIGVGGAGWYFKIYKNKKKPAATDDDVDDSDDDSDDSEDSLDIYDEYENIESGGDEDE